MYVELVPIDLTTVVRLATAQNADIRTAQARARQARGRYESAVGSAFPVIAPLALFEHVEGSVRATEGNLVNVGFNTFQPSIAVQWIINPGAVVYDIVAARKRLHATEHLERSTQQQVLRSAAVQFYELVLAQARIQAAEQAVQESRELVRISELRVRTGTGVPADELRAQARLAERQQDRARAMNGLYRASLALTSTLQLADPTITLVPRLDELPPRTLVSDELTIGELLAFAVAFRPDLQADRELVAAASADRKGTWWRGFGPQLALAYQYGGITGHANNTDKGQGIPSNLLVNPLSPSGAFSANPLRNGLAREGILRGSRSLARNRDETFSFSDQQRASAGIGARWGLSSFGDVKASAALTEQAMIAAEQTLIDVQVEVVDAMQTSRLQRQLIDLADHQTRSAGEALRLVNANLTAGTMTTLDVLQAQDTVAQARLRYAEAVVQYNQAQIHLVTALGALDETLLLVE